MNWLSAAEARADSVQSLRQLDNRLGSVRRRLRDPSAPQLLLAFNGRSTVLLVLQLGGPDAELTAMHIRWDPPAVGRDELRGDEHWSPDWWSTDELELLIVACADRARDLGCEALCCHVSTGPLANDLIARGFVPEREARAPAYSAAAPSGSEVTLRMQLSPLVGPGIAFARFDDVPWENWHAERVGTLLFVVREDEILLMRKKRGHGAGLINAPGGKREPNETALACALRETREELGIEVLDAEHAGELQFQYSHGERLRGVVFRASRFRGTCIETVEGAPLWFPLQDIPFDEMWDDDRLWLPWLCRREPFVGRFLIHGERLAFHRILPAPNKVDSR